MRGASFQELARKPILIGLKCFQGIRLILTHSSLSVHYVVVICMTIYSWTMLDIHTIYIIHDAYIM